jgi:hypothetical protein
MLASDPDPVGAEVVVVPDVVVVVGGVVTTAGVVDVKYPLE